MARTKQTAYRTTTKSNDALREENHKLHMEKLNLKDEIEVLKTEIEEMKRRCTCDTKAKKRLKKDVLQDCIRELQQISN